MPLDSIHGYWRSNTDQKEPWWLTPSFSFIEFPPGQIDHWKTRQTWRPKWELVHWSKPKCSYTYPMTRAHLSGSSSPNSIQTHCLIFSCAFSSSFLSCPISVILSQSRLPLTGIVRFLLHIHWRSTLAHKMKDFSQFPNVNFALCAISSHLGSKLSQMVE